ncbi:MAG: arylsulfatase [Alphaproteobacteria bacterium]|nr:arylsulfatase [Alphaproteobacteria bacterium]MBU1514594.1 arylsulfatase [Alphaproteobacteria bacterium]MBU2096774.1 arylsulfatase [Alphaproteobacteria bacterium]MBU2150406.1 arylsulfatase [Alphaproteobacteria bacterium]MBU2306593.1 arylsulfatase [Alphaproteobacteria bacterium]
MSGKIGRTVADSIPSWPEPPKAPKGAPNILVVLFDDVGFSDFGCYGSPIRTPTIDRLAAEGLRYAGFHTTAMCSTTRAALLTGRNHHSVGVGCLANFDSGYPGYRGKIDKAAGTLPEMLRPHGYRNYMLGKWHVTNLTETGPSGPFDGWPLGRGFDKFYGFMDAETDQYAPELVRDNTPITPPGTFQTGYHLTEDLTDQAIRYIADHTADAPDVPWLLWFAPGACHAPHQAPADLIKSYDPVFQHGWDVEREQRLARQKAMGLVPPDTKLPPPNDGIRPWDSYGDDERRVFTRLQSAFAAMLDHTDQQLARLVGFLESAGVRDDTLIIVMSDNGASQEGGPLGFVNAMGPFNFRGEPMAEKLARIDDIGGPDTHSNFPQGWAMASNTPLRRYKQNTHGGGIRDPLVISWPNRIEARGEVRPHFAHASDLVPTLLELIGVQPPSQVNGVPQMPLEGESFAASLMDAAAPARAKPQYFEMFGHRGLWKDGWKAVAFHPPGTPFDSDTWELFHLDADFSETDDLAAAQPDRLKALVDDWWAAAEANKVLPLDDRFAPRFVENSARFHGARRKFVLHAGMGHLPTDVAPDVRARSYRIEADVRLKGGEAGVLLAHGDATSGYSLYVQDGRLHHTLNIGGQKTTVSSDRPIPATATRLGVVSRKVGEGLNRTFTLTIDGAPAGEGLATTGFVTLISWSGLDIGLDRGSPVADYAAPFSFTGTLRKVTVVMDADQTLDGDAVGEAEMARQ